MAEPKQRPTSLLTGSDSALKLDPEIEAKLRALKLRLDSLSLRQSLLKTDPTLSSGFSLTSPTLGAPKPPTPIVPAGKGPAKPRPGQPGDVLSALMGVPAVKRAVEKVKTEATDKLRRDWKKLSKGEKAGVVSTAVVIAGGALAGVLSQDKTRQGALEFVQGKSIPVPGVDGLSFSVSPVGKDKKFMVNFDLAAFIRSRTK